MTRPGERPVTLEVIRVVDETPDTRSLVFRVPPGMGEAWAYRPGQFLTLRVPSDRDGSVARCYSMSSSPHVDQDLQITVKRTADGYASNWLCDHIEPGGSIDALGPSGRFTPRSLDERLLLFAGGSGITPVFSILKSVLLHGSGSATLFYANRDERSVVFSAELADLARRYASRLEVVHWLDSVQGHPTDGTLAAFLAGRDADEAFVCGPAAFMQAVVGALESAGMPRADVHREIFGSRAGDPFAKAERAAGEPAAAAPAGRESADRTVPVEVLIDGRTLTLPWPADTTLVDVLLAEGVDVPYLCRDGECGTCQATVEQGSVAMDRNDVLDEEDLEAGYVLTCQSRPDGDGPIRVVY